MVTDPTKDPGVDDAPSSSPPDPKRPASSRRFRMGPVRSLGIPITYAVLLLLLLYAYAHGATASVSDWAFFGVVAVVVLYLARELSVTYVIDQRYLRAWRLFGTRRLRLSRIRKVELVSLRDLSPSGFTGTWGWRSRVWSPQIGKFDAIQTYHRGVLLHGEGVPLFISPRDRDVFVHELVPRIRRTNPTVETPFDASGDGDPPPG